MFTKHEQLLSRDGSTIDLSIHHGKRTRHAMAQNSEDLTQRRHFLTAGIYGLASLIAGALSLPATLYLFHQPKNRKQSGWVDAGDISKLRPGTPQEVIFRRNRIDGWKIHSEKESAWVTRNPDGTLTAFSPWCTHLGCAYHWESTRDAFMCPCHGSWFSPSGDVISGPAPRSLDQYEVKLEGKRLWLGPVRAPRES